MDYARYCPAIWGGYVEGHTNPTITNTIAERTFSGINLGTTGNLQGSPEKDGYPSDVPRHHDELFSCVDALF